MVKTAFVQVVWLSALFVACGPSPHTETNRRAETGKQGPDPQVVRRASRNIAYTVADLQAASGVDRPGGDLAAGHLWREVDRLKRDGQNTKNLAWHVSELEENLRGSRQDAAARRHILDNLNSELERLNRRNR